MDNMKKMTKFFALALLAGAMVSCSTEDTAPTTANGKVAVQFTGGISVTPVPAEPLGTTVTVSASPISATIPGTATCLSS